MPMHHTLIVFEGMLKLYPEIFSCGIIALQLQHLDRMYRYLVLALGFSFSFHVAEGTGNGEKLQSELLSLNSKGLIFSHAFLYDVGKKANPKFNLLS